MLQHLEARDDVKIKTFQRKSFDGPFDYFDASFSAGLGQGRRWFDRDDSAKQPQTTSLFAEGAEPGTDFKEGAVRYIVAPADVGYALRPRSKYAISPRFL